MAKIQELRDLSEEELEVRQEDLRKKIFELRNQQKLEKKIEESHLLRESKKEIARILTIMREKKISS